jgi:CheY-like chemotaxis protein
MTSEPTDQHKRIRVLIVEDDELQMQVLEAGLTAVGFEVETVADGLEAVWKVRAGHYDVVLVDYQVPKIDGLATAHLVSDLMSQPARPVLIALTATPKQLQARENGEPSAFNAVLGKPWDLASLHLIITRCLEVAPDSATRRAAETQLMLQCWMDYDTEPDRPGANGDDPGPARILVIEDDNLQQAMLTSVLQSQGYVVETASDGLEGVRRIREGCYDLVLVDYNLPAIDGLAVASMVHDLMTQDMRPRLVAITATPARLRDSEKQADIIFDDIADKSADLQELIRSVDHLLKSSPNPVARRAAASVRPIDATDANYAP